MTLTWRKRASVLWFPIFFAVALPVCFLSALHRPLPHNEQVAFVGNAKRERAISDALHGLAPGGFDVRRFSSPMAAIAAVHGRNVAVSYLGWQPTHPGLVEEFRTGSYRTVNA